MANKPPHWITPFDGLRAIAMLLVLSTHLATSAKADLGARLGLGLFMMQSGYLITAALLREESKFGAVDLGAFYIRRATRLFPAYYVVLALYSVLFLVVGIEPNRRPVFVAAMPYYLTYLQEIPFYGWHGDMPFFQTWTLGLEEKFYLAWPIFAFRVPRTFRTRLWAAIAVFTATSILRTNVGWGRYVGAMSPIAGGCILALVLDAPERRDALLGWAKRWSTPIAMTWLGWHLLSYFGPSKVEFSMHYVYPFVTAVVLLACLTDSGLARMVSVAPLRFLGRVAYGFFLLHVMARSIAAVMLARVGIVDSPVAVFVLSAILATMGAWPLYRLIEEPVHEWGRRLSFRQRIPIVVTAAPPDA